MFIAKTRNGTVYTCKHGSPKRRCHTLGFRSITFEGMHTFIQSLEMGKHCKIQIKFEFGDHLQNFEWPYGYTSDSRSSILYCKMSNSNVI